MRPSTLEQVEALLEQLGLAMRALAASIPDNATGSPAAVRGRVAAKLAQAEGRLPGLREAAERARTAVREAEVEVNILRDRLGVHR